MTVASTICTEHEAVTFLSAVADSSVVICGKLSDQWKLKLYNLKIGAEVCTARLPNEPDGMTTVTLGDRRCLALSYT